MMRQLSVTSSRSFRILYTAMDDANLQLARSLISKSYVDQGAQTLHGRRKRIKSLLSERKLPREGWDDATIESLLHVDLRFLTHSHSRRTGSFSHGLRRLSRTC